MTVPVRVAHLIDQARDTEYFRSLARHHDRSRYRLWVGSLEPPGSLQEAMGEMDVGSFAMEVRGRRWYWRAVPTLARWLRSRRIRILHLHTFYASVVGTLAGRLARVPHLVMTRHHSDHLLRLNRPVHHAADRWVTGQVDAVIAVSRETRRIMVEEERADPQRIRVVHNGIEPRDPPCPERLEELRRELDLPGAPVGITVARLHEEKGHRYLVRALPRILQAHPDFTHLLVGEGLEEPSLRKLAEEKGVRRALRFAGYRTDAVDLMALADLMLHPALAESFGFVLVEAMAVGTPPVATRIGGIPEVVEDGVTGLLVPPEDPDALADAAIRLLGDPNRRGALARAGRRRVGALFTAEGMVRGYEKVYEEALAGPVGKGRTTGGAG